MLSKYFIERPVLGNVIALITMLIGAVSIFGLPIAQYPPMTPPTVQVTTNWPGASAALVQQLVASNIENQVNGVQDMLYMESDSTNDGRYTLTVTFQVGSIDVLEADIEAQVDRLRENEGELTDVDRPIAGRDFVTLDLIGKDTEGNVVADVSDYLYEVGSGAIVEELDDALRGLKAGETTSVTSTMPDDREVTFEVTISGVQEKLLPELTDAWVAEASEFETIEALRGDIIDRLSRMKIMQAQFSLRESAMSALANLVDDVHVSDLLVDAEVNERLNDLGHRLESQKLSIEQFLTATNQTGEALVESLRGESVTAVKVDLALRAVAAAEGLGVSEAELDEEIVKLAEQFSTTPARLREQLDNNGRTVSLKGELGKTKASAWLLDNVEVVDEEGKSVDRELLKRNAAEEGES